MSFASINFSDRAKQVDTLFENWQKAADQDYVLP